MWGRGGRASMPVTTSRSCLFNGETSTLTRTSCGPGGGGSSMWTRRSTCAGSPNGSIWVARISIPLHRRLGHGVSLPDGYALLPREVRPRYCGCLPSLRRWHLNRLGFDAGLVVETSPAGTPGVSVVGSLLSQAPRANTPRDGVAARAAVSLD